MHSHSQGDISKASSTTHKHLYEETQPGTRSNVVWSCAYNLQWRTEMRPNSGPPPKLTTSCTWYIQQGLPVKLSALQSCQPACHTASQSACIFSANKENCRSSSPFSKMHTMPSLKMCFMSWSRKTRWKSLQVNFMSTGQHSLAPSHGEIEGPWLSVQVKTIPSCRFFAFFSSPGNDETEPQTRNPKTPKLQWWYLSLSPWTNASAHSNNNLLSNHLVTLLHLFWCDISGEENGIWSSIDDCIFLRKSCFSFASRSGLTLIFHDL